MSRPRRGTGPLPFALMCLMIACLGGGCTQTSVARVGPYRVGGESLIRTAPATGVYSVQWRGDDIHRKVEVEGTRLVVVAGEPIGFETAADGRVVAVAGEKRLDLPALPASAKYCLWYHRFEQPSRSGEQALRVLQKTMLAVAVGALVVYGVWALLQPDDDRWFDEDDRSRGRRPTRSLQFVESSHPRQGTD